MKQAWATRRARLGHALTLDLEREACLGLVDLERRRYIRRLADAYNKLLAAATPDRPDLVASFATDYSQAAESAFDETRHEGAVDFVGYLFRLEVEAEE